ncbi:GH3 auxin-responsive promoter [bacterium (Candidatus Blackallbacteria) CG17_big_fil_post_rev_8_21_14_2_50_48_46]|uniref:GH3 auxin-responsive promoter n=1 Tax=bacterium (Candidatus Blackallbacteria) CG17_big_fil_post_rev_8_21_14_2_50_48_46 TaxID=2014261 RepID=A0A2M7FXK5_9BACT|nr:MAG: GH3 auxin-responsive promoter [bacterium (Candidatus Blackallbacteria) CG18_big_fil_WC_8_21_14_2_50_49_26]PIW13981.1 MAG: GH3 auxin-responsive promoter [bacterium (Candidatus Blackallbacteria) CG17_big_fil_post_rev_8_21_14_2_50_48_46]PIW46832.1 MAG: GH3 auxin-responsive promoter [bacterium (Candidatus Blackallbacteria) CG13_big_fil_rev_8_21_14_2_50_49_14]
MSRAGLLTLFRWATDWSWKRFERALQTPSQAQNQTLQAILKASSLKGIHDYARFRQLPLRSYEDLAPRILAAKTSERGFLSRQRPRAYEPTSGSSGAQKLIPYTPALIASFTQLFVLWAHDFLTHGPALKGGRLYFSISPQFHETNEGLSDDSDYLSGPTAWLFRQFALVSPHIKKLKNPDDFFKVLALSLLAAEDLEIISIWSPSFLLSLLNFIQNHREMLLEAGQKTEHKIAGLHFQTGALPADKQTELRKTEPNWQILFPTLKLISCWGAQNARTGFEELKRLFPHCHVQEKGLLATEAPISFPSEKYHLFLPLLTQVFFEFLDHTGQILLLDQIQIGQSYELIISQKSGLLRYRLGDRVRVVGKALNTPCFEFLGRDQAISDLVGEKLNEDYLAQIAQSLWPALYLCLVPDSALPGYTLFSNAPLNIQAFEAELMRSPHYCNARQLQQLKPLQAVVVPDLSEKLKRFFSQERGLKWGDVKDRYLYSQEKDGNLSGFLKN